MPSETSVSMVAVRCTQPRPGRPGGAGPGPQHHQGGQDRGQPGPAGIPQGREHRQGQDGRGRRPRPAGGCAPRRRPRRRPGRRPRRSRGIPFGERRGSSDRRVVDDGGPLGGQVDAGRGDPRRAGSGPARSGPRRRRRSCLDRQVDPGRARPLRRRCRHRPPSASPDTPGILGYATRVSGHADRRRRGRLHHAEAAAAATPAPHRGPGPRRGPHDRPGQVLRRRGHPGAAIQAALDKVSLGLLDGTSAAASAGRSRPAAATPRSTSCSR